MASHTTEVVTGAGVLAIAVGFFLYAGQITGFSGGASSETYWASFRSVEGVSVGTDVRLSGVKVGAISAIDLNPATFRADTHFSVASSVELPEDSAVIIASEGLLGGSFVELLPGGSPFNLEPGAEIEDTQSSISIINLLMKFVTSDGDDE
ncbi:MAG: outer membrane lipid asymmetry maintenance protein MlaD [Rhodobacteraceae bacterium]|nr:outer membrane lipid asymmetry maintenance protein MlaD [Paracoccaceae bacterium]